MHGMLRIRKNITEKKTLPVSYLWNFDEILVSLKKLNYLIKQQIKQMKQ